MRLFNTLMGLTATALFSLVNNHSFQDSDSDVFVSGTLISTRLLYGYGSKYCSSGLTTNWLGAGMGLAACAQNCTGSGYDLAAVADGSGGDNNCMCGNWPLSTCQSWTSINIYTINAPAWVESAANTFCPDNMGSWRGAGIGLTKCKALCAGDNNNAITFGHGDGNCMCGTLPNAGCGAFGATDTYDATSWSVSQANTYCTGGLTTTWLGASTGLAACKVLCSAANGYNALALGADGNCMCGNTPTSSCQSWPGIDIYTAN